ncbi:hypothetical protein [Streptomyces sp. NRRL F-2664]|uniref:hypothetical protein n=1 Tax=Streptomyces sp. NRRL F-2664 TaxID=1463842 RepID=UPI00131CE9DA|nr:hypothetical protein [Streptomyces sp. NRRL F-2664]
MPVPVAEVFLAAAFAFRARAVWGRFGMDWVLAGVERALLPAAVVAGFPSVVLDAVHGG